MAIIRGEVFGDVRGRIGGTVFQKNKAGKILRAYVKGIDAKTEAQMEQRGNYSLVAERWKVITTAQRQAWTTFASSIYAPKIRRGGNQWSGVNAFIGCNSQIVSCYHRSSTITIDSGAVSFTTSPFPQRSDDPATYSFYGLVLDDTGKNFPLNFSDTIFDVKAGTISYKLNFGSIPSGHIKFKNPAPSNYSTCFALYLSIPVGETQMFTPKMNSVLISSIPPIDDIVATGNDSILITHALDPDFTAKLKYGFPVGAFIYISLYAVSIYGQGVLIGNLKTPIVSL
jgi:hypothetical protein